jgi:hypothetical protein
LYPFPHLVGVEGSMLSGVSSRALPIANSPKALGMPSYKFSPMHITNSPSVVMCTLSGSPNAGFFSDLIDVGRKHSICSCNGHL